MPAYRSCLPVALAICLQLPLLAAPSVFPTGVTRYQPARAYNSYVFFAGQDKQTHLIDMNGKEVHRWAYDGFPAVYLDPALAGGQRGNVLVQLAGSTGGRARPGDSQALGEVDWAGKPVWQWGGAAVQEAYAGGSTSPDTRGFGSRIRQHNDWRRLTNGRTAILASQLREAPGFKAGKVLDDLIVEVDAQGEPVWQWSAFDHLAEFGFSPAALQLLRDTVNRADPAQALDFVHLNTLTALGPNRWFDAGDSRFHPDNYLIGSREANFLAIVARDSGKLVWRLGPDYPAITRPNTLPRPVDQLIGQHDAHLIAPGLPGAGNLLVFDNQGVAGYPLARPQTQPASRVLEIDPVRGEIVWQYSAVQSGQPAYSFYSAYISSARRLPNGNTLIAEGMNGRLFQVTPTGEIVWEYVSPFFSEARTGDTAAIASNNVYRAQPVPYDWAPPGTPRSEVAVARPDPRQFRVAGPAGGTP